MAWRIDEAVLRGELDNTVRGRVTGRIWFVDRDEPVALDLTGDCHRDLAGRRLNFTNPEPKRIDLGKFAALQQGRTGDITASRKVRVPDIPLDRIGEYHEAKKPLPWHWGNSLYLEWFSERNGRVVIESAAYDLKIVGEPTWEMSPAEEETQREANAGATDEFAERLSSAFPSPPPDASHSAPGSAFDDAADDDRPMTEEEAERMQERSDLLADRISARVAREGPENYGQIVHEEVERLRRERGEPEPTEEQLARNAEWLAEIEAEEFADDLAPGAEDDASSPEETDGESTTEGDDEDPFGPRHPLAERAFQLSLRLLREPEERGWATQDDSPEHPVIELGLGVMKAGAKLSGTLDCDDWPPDVRFAASDLVRLKRARGFLDDSLQAAADCREQNLTETAWLATVHGEITEIATAVDALIAELRALLKQAGGE